MRNRQAAMLRAASISLAGNIVLFLVKLAALILVRSLAIATDLGITVAALVVSVILYHAVKVSNRPADLVHNYGYGKIEHICEAVEGIVLIGIALVMSSQAVMHILHPGEATRPWFGLGFSLVSVLINFTGSAWILSLAKACHSPAVQAEGIHYRLEGFISLTIATAFLLVILLLPTPLKAWTAYLDPVATLIVSVWITVPSFNMARHAFLTLLDASLEEGSKMEVLKQLGKHLGSCCEFRNTRSRSSGQKKFVECDVVLPRQISFAEAYRISTVIEEDLRKGITGCEPSVRVIPCDENCSFRSLPEKCPYLRS